MTRDISIASIVRPAARARGRHPIDLLRQSIAEIGLLHPIIVTETLHLVGGLHRLLACESLGWETIPATVLPLDEADARLAELDENLARYDLTALERAEHHAERKRLYLARHPGTKRGANRSGGGQFAPSRQLGDSVAEPRYTAAAAARVDESERAVQRHVLIGERLDDEAKELIRDTGIADNQQDLLRLSALPVAEQREVAQRIAGGVKNVRAAKIAMVAQSIQEEPPPLPGGAYRVLVVDPPWPYEKRAGDAPPVAPLPEAD